MFLKEGPVWTDEAVWTVAKSATTTGKTKSAETILNYPDGIAAAQLLSQSPFSRRAAR